MSTVTQVHGTNKLERKRTLAVPRIETTTDVWLTPKPIIDALGPFTLDPCHNEVRPFETARHYFTEAQDGLKQDWRPYGRIWLNPPYGAQTKPWLNKLADHGDGFALVFAKTETDAMAIAWARGSAMLFLRKRIQFLLPSGLLPEKPGSGAGSVIVAFGEECARVLENCGLEGWFVRGVRYVGKKNLFDETPPASISQPFPTPWVLHDVEFNGIDMEGMDDKGDRWLARDLDQRCALCECYEEGGWMRERDGFYACPDCVTQGTT